MRKGIFYVLILVISLVFRAFDTSAQYENLERQPEGYRFHWMWRDFKCKLACLSGQCDNGDLCDNYFNEKKYFAEANPDSVFQFSGNKIYLNRRFLFLFTGEARRPGRAPLLRDANDRVLVTFYGLRKKTSENKKKSIVEFHCRPLSLKDFDPSASLYIGKLPDEFPFPSEYDLRIVSYCNGKLRCMMWSAYDRMYRVEKHFRKPEYAPLPLVIDTMGGGQPRIYSQKKEFKFVITPGINPDAGEYERGFRKQLDKLEEAPFITDKMEILVYPVLGGDSTRNHQTAIRNGLAMESLIRNITSSSAVVSKIEPGNILEDFRYRVRHTARYPLADSSYRSISRLLSPPSDLNTSLASCLVNQNMMEIKLRVHFDTTLYGEKQYWLYQVQKFLHKNDAARAQENFTPLFRLFHSGMISKDELKGIDIPQDIDFVMLLNNLCAVSSNADEQRTCFEQLASIDPNNPLVKYNLLATALNRIEKLPENRRSDTMFSFISDYYTINQSSIPAQIYDALENRFYPFINDNRGNIKLDNAEKIEKRFGHARTDDAIAIADFYAKHHRYDIAVSLLRGQFTRLDSSKHELRVQCALRLLCYGKKFSVDLDYDEILFYLKQANPELFFELFRDHDFSILFFGSPAVEAMLKEKL